MTDFAHFENGKSRGVKDFDVCVCVCVCEKEKDSEKYVEFRTFGMGGVCVPMYLVRLRDWRTLSHEIYKADRAAWY